MFVLSTDIYTSAGIGDTSAGIGMGLAQNEYLGGLFRSKL